MGATPVHYFMSPPREGIKTLGELREWLQENISIPNDTEISVNVDGMEGTGDFYLKYHKETNYVNSPRFPDQERFNEPACIWIEDA